MAESSITKNFDATLIDRVEGGELKFNGKSLTAHKAILMAFFNVCQGDERDPENAPARYAIGMKVTPGGDIAYTPEELAAIRIRVRRYWPASQISGQVEEIIDKKEA